MAVLVLAVHTAPQLVRNVLWLILHVDYFLISLSEELVIIYSIRI